MQHAPLHNGPSKASAQSQQSRPPRLPPPGSDARFSGVPAAALAAVAATGQGPPPIARSRAPMAARALEKEKEQRANAWVRAGNANVNPGRVYPSLQGHEMQDAQQQQQHASQQQQGDYDFQRAQLLSAQHDIPYQPNGLSMLPSQGYGAPPGTQYGNAPFFDTLSKVSSMSPQQQMLPSALDKGVTTSPPQLHQKQQLVQDERLLMSQQQQQRHYQQQHYQQQQVQHHQQQHPTQQQHHQPQQHHRNPMQHKQDLYHHGIPDQENAHYQAFRQQQDLQFQQQHHAPQQYHHHEQIPSAQQQQHPATQDHLAAHHQQALSHHIPDHAPAAQQHLYQDLHPQQQAGNHLLMRQMHSQQQQQHASMADTHLDHSYGLPLPAQDPSGLRKNPAELLAWETSAAAGRGGPVVNNSRDGSADHNPAALLPQPFVPNPLFDIALTEVRQPPPLPVHSSQQHMVGQQQPLMNVQQQGVPAQQNAQQPHGQQQPQPPQVPDQRQLVPQQRATAQRQVRPQAPVQQQRPPSSLNAGHTSQGGPQGQQTVQQPQSARRSVKQQPALVPNGRHKQPVQPPADQVAAAETQRQQSNTPRACADSAANGNRISVNGNGSTPANGPASGTANGTVTAPVQQSQQSLPGAVGDAVLAAQPPSYYKNVRKAPPSGAQQSTPRKRRLNEPSAVVEPAPTVSNPNRIDCQYCGQVFDQKRVRDLHVRTIHERSFPCDKCFSLFKTKSDANRHMRIVHDRVRPYSCTECSANFAERGKLRRHKQTVHEKLRPYTCPVCGAQFGERGNLNQHQTSRHAGAMLNSATANRAT